MDSHITQLLSTIVVQFVKCCLNLTQTFRNFYRNIFHKRAKGGDPPPSITKGFQNKHGGEGRHNHIPYLT